MGNNEKIMISKASKSLICQKILMFLIRSPQKLEKIGKYEKMRISKASKSLIFKVWRPRYNTTIITTTTESLVPRGGQKSSIPAISHDTLRDRRKGDPTTKCCGNKLGPKF